MHCDASLRGSLSKLVLEGKAVMHKQLAHDVSCIRVR